jgi:hypothetical protein
MIAQRSDEFPQKLGPVEKSGELKRWARTLQQYGLANIAVLALDVLQVWGFVGGQLLWMLEPFWQNDGLTTLAETLEQPEALRDLQAYLLEDQVKS